MIDEVRQLLSWWDSYRPSLTAGLPGALVPRLCLPVGVDHHYPSAPSLGKTFPNRVGKHPRTGLLESEEELHFSDSRVYQELTQGARRGLYFFPTHGV